MPIMRTKTRVDICNGDVCSQLDVPKRGKIEQFTLFEFNAKSDDILKGWSCSKRLAWLGIYAVKTAGRNQCGAGGISGG